jgi:hypothetical protein
MAVSIKVMGRSGSRAEMQLAKLNSHLLRLDFVADANRTQLVIAPSGDSHGASWLLSNLSLEAAV